MPIRNIKKLRNTQGFLFVAPKEQILEFPDINNMLERKQKLWHKI